MFSVFVTAQDILYLSKQQVLDSVLKNNINLKIAIEEHSAAQGAYNQSAAVMLPQIALKQTAFVSNSPLMAFGFKLNQASVSAADFNPDLLNNPSDTRDYTTQLSLQQPLVNVDGWQYRKAAKAKLDATSFKGERTQDYVRLAVEQAYMQLQLAYKSVSVIATAQKSIASYQKVAEEHYNLGYLLKSDYLAINVRAIEVDNQYQQAQHQLATASNYLHLMMNSKDHRLIQPTDVLEVNAHNFATSLPDSRADLLAVEKKTEAYQYLYQASKYKFVPRINAFGNLDLHSNTWMENENSNYLAGVQLQWDLFKGGSQLGSVKEAKANYKKASLEEDLYKNESELNLNKAQRSFEDAKNTLESAELALEQLEEALRIRENRFEEGLEHTSDLLKTQAQLAEKSLYYAAAIFNYNYSSAYLNFLTQE